jgi:ABC-type dipeptide/oligopeptide/nickel transport system permease component
MSLLAYTLRRLLWAVPLLLGVMLLTFALLRGMGGSPFRLETGGVPPTLQQRFTDYYRLDEPWFVEFANYVRQVATFNFGPSLVDRWVSVDTVMRNAVPVTAALAAIAAGWAVLIGVPLGVAAALRRSSALDYLASGIATTLLALPIFLVVHLASRYVAADWGLVSFGWQHWSTRLFAGLVLGLAPAGYVARLIRAAVVETLQADYVRTARAKGLRRQRILVAHVLRNSLAPALGAVPPTLALLVTGTFFVESRFHIPGAGVFFVSAAKTRDYPMVLGLTVALAAVVILANLVADVAAAAIDPRVRERS